MNKLVLMGALLLPGFAFSQTEPPAGASPAAPKVKVERSASGQKIFRITEGIVVEGKIQKPNAFYVLQRSSIDYDWESLKQDFMPKILQATGKHPF
jgi:hypothetical protein